MRRVGLALAIVMVVLLLLASALMATAGRMVMQPEATTMQATTTAGTVQSATAAPAAQELGLLTYAGMQARGPTTTVFGISALTADEQTTSEANMVVAAALDNLDQMDVNGTAMASLPPTTLSTGQLAMAEVQHSQGTSYYRHPMLA